MDTDTYTILGLIGAFLFFLAALRHYTRRSLFPPESWLVIGGVAYALLQQNIPTMLPPAVLPAEVVLMFLLPVLIFASGSTLSPLVLRREWRPIALFAIPGVILSMLVIGLPLAWVMDLPWSHGLMFGAAVAATDPSAVGVIFRRFGLPERLLLIIEGESLFNDGIAIVLFGATTALVLGKAMIGVGSLTMQLIWSLLAAIPFGLLLGWGVGKVVAGWQEQNRFSGLTLTVILCYGTFIIAEHFLHFSGVIAVLCAALAFHNMRCGNTSEKPHQQEWFHAFWEYLNTLVSGVLFFALGSAVGHHAFFINWVVPMVVVLMLLSRVILIYGGNALLALFANRLPENWQPVLFLGGLRGAVSAALVLLIPEDYPHRIELLCLVFILIMFTLLVHPLLLRRYLQRTTTGNAL